MYALIRWVSVITFVTVLFCTLPDDPSKDPDNATATFATIDGTIPVMPVAVTAGNVVDIALRLYLPAYITSIAVSIEAPGEDADTQTVFTGPWSDTLMNFNIVFSKTGSRWCIVTAHRSSGSSISDTLTFTVTRRIDNRPPLWSRDTIDFELLWNVRDSMDLQEHVSDPDSDAVTLVADSVANTLGLWLNGTVLSSDPVCDTGTVVANIIASDGSLFDTVVVRRRVAVPVIALRTDTAEVPESGTLLIDVLDNDSISSGMLTLAKAIGNRLGTVTLEGNKLQYSADKGAEGIDTVWYTVTNGPDTGMVIITIGEQRFFMASDTASIFVNGERKIDVLANDSVSFGSIVITSLFGGVTGNAELRESAVYYHAHGITEGKDTVYYVVNNGRDTGMVIITVLPAVVTVHDDSAELDEDAAAARIDALANDSISTGTMTLTWVSTGKIGETSIVDNMVVYTPFSDSNGIDTLRYLINGAAEGVVIIVIRPVNDTPLVADTSLATPEDTALAIKLSGIDADGDELVYRVVARPVHGTITDDSSGNLVYTPDADFSGVDSLKYTANDREASSSVARVTITVQPRNDAPRIVRNIGLTLAEGGSAIIDGTSFACSDPDDDSSDISVTIAELPQNGILERSETEVYADESFAFPDFIAGGFTYTHDGEETAADSIRVIVSDGRGSISALIRITITAVNDLPLFSKTGAQMKSSANLGNRYRDTVDVFDAEGNYSAMSVSVVPSSLKYSFSKSTGRIVIDWCVDQRAYSVGDAVPVAIEVKDGSGSVKLEWFLTVGKHVWTKVTGETSSAGSIVAIDSFVLINGRCTGHFGEFAYIDRNDLRGTEGWQKLFLWSPPSIGCNLDLGLAGNKLYVTSLYETIVYDLESNDTSSIGMDKFFVGADTMVNYFKAGWDGECNKLYHNNEGSICYVDTNPDGSINTLEDMVSMDDATFILNKASNSATGMKSYSLLRWGHPWWSIHGTPYKDTAVIPDAGDFQILCSDNNNGDTMFALAGENALVRFPNARSPVSTVYRSVERVAGVDGVNALTITMLDGFTGYITGSDEKLYYTNDSFVSLTEEFVAADVIVESVVISSDKKAIFAIVRDFSYNWAVYRY